MRAPTLHRFEILLTLRARWSSASAMVERAKASVTFHAMTSSADDAGRLALFEVSSSALDFLSCDAQKIFCLAAREDSPPPASAWAASWYDQPGGSGSGARNGFEGVQEDTDNFDVASC